MRPKLLLVDDVPANLLALEAVLRDLDVTLVKANSGSEALKQALDHEFAAILLDVMMPGMDGFETAARLRQNERLREVPIVFITAFPQDETRTQRGYEVGAFDFIYKPISTEILRSKVKVYLQLAEQKQTIKVQSLNELKNKWEAARLKEELDREALYRLFVENVKDYAVFMLDPDGKITSWNVTAERIFGYEAHEVLGREFSLLFTEGDVAAGIWSAELLKAELHGRAEDVRWHLKKDRSVFWADGLVTPLRDAGGTLKGFCKLLRDRTDTKLWQEKLKKTAEQLSEKNQELDRFVQVVSHDLKEPLRTVNSFLGLLWKKYHGALDAAADEYIRFSVDAARRMRLLVDNLLVQYTDVGEPASPTEIDLDDVLSRVLEDLRITLEESEASVVRKKLPRCVADPVQVAQIFQNLLTNAIKFRGEAPPEIEVASELRDGEFVLTVKDNGVGIDMNASQRIFEPLARLDSVAVPGTGIGLSVCKEIVERLGGRIWVESSPGGGAAFNFTVPRCEASTAVN